MRRKPGRYASWSAPRVRIETRLTGPRHFRRPSEQQALRLRIPVRQQSVEATRVSRELLEKPFQVRHRRVDVLSDDGHLSSGAPHFVQRLGALLDVIG